jgi:hypothetical protein
MNFLIIASKKNKKQNIFDQTINSADQNYPPLDSLSKPSAQSKKNKKIFIHQSIITVIEISTCQIYL